MRFWILTLLNVMCWGLTDVNAQNLVPNPSFENYRRLPCILNEFFIQDVLENWVQPIPTTPDYWRTDIDISCDLNPNRISRQGRTGKAMTGIITASIFKDFKNEYKEYLEVQLNRPLVEGKLYCGEFYTFNVNKVMFGPSDIFESNNLSMAFSDTLVFYSVSTNPPDNLTSPSWVKISEPKVIPTDNKWHRVEGCFVADKKYQYLLLGNFQSINQSQVNRTTIGNDFASAYHFIDDVLLMEMPYDPPALADQITFCHNENSITLDATTDGATGYTWQDGSTGSQFVVTKKQTDSYRVNISYGNFTYKHTFHVQYVPNIDLGTDSFYAGGKLLP